MRGASRVLAQPDPVTYAQVRELASQASRPAATGRALFGTASWADKGLIQSGLFYPKNVTTAEARLAYYSEHFPLVEVDSSFYTLFPPELAQRWLSWTPASFIFNVKAFPAITGHLIDVARLPKDLRELCEAAGVRGRTYPGQVPRELMQEFEQRFAAFLEPFQAERRLGAVLVQFPPWFAATRGNARRIESIAERWSRYPLSVEFRHPSWLDESRRQRVIELLTRCRVSYVCADAPPFAGTEPLLAATHPKLATLRFHGQNCRAWSTPEASLRERHDYLYTPSELESWALRLHELSRLAERVHVIFTNSARDYAVINAKSLAVLAARASFPALRQPELA